MGLIMNMQIKQALDRGLVEVVFIKKDGTERTLVATLREDLIPEDRKPKGGERVASIEVQPVYDVENDGWRSFRWDSVINYRIQ